MKNEHENFVPEIDTAVKLANVETELSPSCLDEALNAATVRHNLDSSSQNRIRQLLEPMSADTIPSEVIDMLVSAIRRDEDVSNAEATGYVRGRNESIDAGLNLPRDSDDELQETVFPRYVRRSIWDASI